MNGKITLTKERYQELVEKAERFDVIQKMTSDFPQEDLKDYAHPTRIKNSYKKASKLYPPLSA
ncbi:MAG: hypothetical protein AAB394_02240 [Patescibacteria group bacterium]